jgi:plastocyanin
MQARSVRNALLAAVTAAALTVFLAGCGGGSGSGTTSTTATGAPNGAAQGGAVEIKGFAFDPASLTVTPGTKVTWSNDDSTSHTATADDGSFDTGTIKQGSKVSATLRKPGTYSYVCQFHPFMKGTITVQG